MEAPRVTVGQCAAAGFVLATKPVLVLQLGFVGWKLAPKPVLVLHRGFVGQKLATSPGLAPGLCWSETRNQAGLGNFGTGLVAA